MSMPAMMRPGKSSLVQSAAYWSYAGAGTTAYGSTDAAPFVDFPKSILTRSGVASRL